VIEDEVDGDPDAALVRASEKFRELLEAAVIGMNSEVIRDVVADIAQG
jgi:hypothetical protein